MNYQLQSHYRLLHVKLLPMRYSYILQNERISHWLLYLYPQYALPHLLNELRNLQHDYMYQLLLFFYLRHEKHIVPLSVGLPHGSTRPMPLHLYLRHVRPSFELCFRTLRRVRICPIQHHPLLASLTHTQYNRQSQLNPILFQ